MTTAPAAGSGNAPASSARTIHWGILGAGGIAKAFARGVAASDHGRLVAVGSRTQEKAEKFADEFNVPTRHGSYEALLADDNVHAIYIATPHPMHPEWAIKAARAGKHILCEKPIGINHAQGMVMIEAARAAGVFFMEAFMYRCAPQTRKLVELVQSGVIGEVRAIQATFSFNSGWKPESRILDNRLGGGGILDVGCYPVSFSRLVAGAAQGKPFADPVELHAVGHIGETRVDEYAAAVLKFPGNIIAQLSTGVQLAQENVARIYGTKGHIVLPTPWIPAREGGTSKIIVHAAGKQPETIEVEADRDLYAYEADVCARAIFAGSQQADSPAMTWADTLGNLATLDRWRRAIGLVYDEEKPENIPVIHRGTLRKPDPDQTPMKYGRVAGLDKEISRFIMGCDNQPNHPHAFAMFDDWYERGGNAFDTAYIYGGGRQEQLLGSWIRQRGLRDQVVVIGKGAHTPHCNPAALRAQLMETLDRLQTDHVDLYIMHRDNPDIPAGEFIDVLNELREEGRLRVFGGSNWSMERFIAANDYAKKHNRQPMGVLSNNFSLARMVDPVWKGCIAASEPTFREFLEASQTPHFAWSSQARGFFTERTDRELESPGFDSELRRCWFSDDNFERRRRAIELAKKKDVLPINIAAAYVLNQAFPSFALVGPRVLHETVTSMPGLEIDLTPDELAWLDLRA